MLSQKAKYAMRALLYLAQAEPEQPVFISEIADQQSVPKKFLELILRELKQHGLVESRKGRNGGYVLSRAPEDISLAAVIRVLDGPIAPLPSTHSPRRPSRLRTRSQSPRDSPMRWAVRTRTGSFIATSSQRT